LSGVAVVVVSAGVVVVELLVVVVVPLLPLEAGLLQPTVNMPRLHKTIKMPIFFISTPFLMTVGRIRFAGPSCTFSLTKDASMGKFIPGFNEFPI
jgi:hypothetical protein